MRNKFRQFYNPVNTFNNKNLEGLVLRKYRICNYSLRQRNVRPDGLLLVSVSP
jgi:hypothetical protein